ncbi:MAG TPA: hemerythrin domain-containing protein [Ferruginibacter sp.]|nr:hemerythrin domain-containing protein [Ferruginibacter sp.]
MKDSTAPIKRSPALIQFSREHHYGLLLVWKIRQGLKKDISPDRINAYTLFFFEKELTEHFKEEEKDLFVKLPVEDKLRIRAFEEHAHIYSLVSQLRENTTNSNLLKEFADALDDHIRFEERILFNHIQKLLPEAELKRLEQSHSKRDGDIDDRWNDHFWEKN